MGSREAFHVNAHKLECSTFNRSSNCFLDARIFALIVARQVKTVGRCYGGTAVLSVNKFWASAKTRG